jgi:two-component system, NarL family, sensor histidine kinase UhpB
VGEDVELPGPARESMLRIVREAVTNAARHGHARCVSVELLERPALELRIADDGVGFDPETLDERSGRRGIAGMRERAVALGGSLSIRSRPGGGSEIGLMLP